MKKIKILAPFLIMPVFIPLYMMLDSLILVEIFGCGCVPDTQTNLLNVPFNANDLRLLVFAALTVGVTAWSIRISGSFSKGGRLLYCAAVFVMNLVLTLWIVKTCMWA